MKGPPSAGTHLRGAGCSLALPTLLPAQLLPHLRMRSNPAPPPRGCRSGLAQGMVAVAPWDTRPASQKHRGSQGLRQPGGGGSRWPGSVHPSVTHECLLCAETSYISASAARHTSP